MAKACASVAFLLALSTSAAFAQTEPWGGNVPGWGFTQTAEPGGVINCRATQGQNLIARRSSGQIYVSVPTPPNLPNGTYREGNASIIIGGAAEPVDAVNSGGRLLFNIDAGNFAPLAKARGYQWRVAGPKGIMSGAVSFSGDVGKAIAAMNACVQANTPAPAAAARPASPPPPAAASANLKWSGDWVWITQGMLTPKRGSIELLGNNKIIFCANVPDPGSCSVRNYVEQNGVYSFTLGDTPGRQKAYAEFRINSDALIGQFWWDEANRTRRGPDGTIVMRRSS